MDQMTWNQFVLEHGPRSGRFLQSWEWGEFQKAVGSIVRRQEFVQEDDQVIGLAQWIDRKLPGVGTYAYCPKGPVLKYGIDLRQESLGESAVFLRIEPERDVDVTDAKKSIELSPAHTLVTDLSQSEEQILKAMHPKTRYNIRVAQKHGVQVDLQEVDFEKAWNVFEQTSARDQFRLHPKPYYMKMIEELSGHSCRAFLATATYNQSVLAANLMVDFGDTRTYLHGASSNEHRNLMAPYVLHWELMMDAKENGKSFYDWWGVAPKDAGSDHPWAGISRFKRGFGGMELSSPGTYDMILKPTHYRVYQLLRMLKRKI